MKCAKQEIPLIQKIEWTMTPNAYGFQLGMIKGLELDSDDN